MSTPNHSPSSHHHQQQQQQPSKRFKSKPSSSSSSSSTTTTNLRPSKSLSNQSGPAYRTRLRTRSSTSKQTQSPSTSPSSQTTISNLNSTHSSNLHHHHHPINLTQDPFPIDPALNESPNRSPSSPSSSELQATCECQSLNAHLTKPRSTHTRLTNPSIITLPGELLEEISNQLSEEIPTLLSLSLTHSRLNFYALKTLYHSPYLDSRYTAWKLRTTLRTHEDLSKFIRVLDIDLNKLCKASMWASWHLQETGGAVVDVLSQCQNLIDLRLQMPKESSMFMQEFIQPIRNLQNLQTFYKDIRHDQDLFNESVHHRVNPPAWISMLQLLSMIGHLSSLKTLAIRGLGSSLSSKPIFKSQSICAQLKTLIIVQTSIKERDLQQLLRYSSGLNSLTLIESTCISKRGLVEALQACGKSLEELTIGPGWWGKSDTSFPLDDVIGSLHELKRLNVEGDLLSPLFFKLTYEANLKKTHQVLVRLDSLKVKKCNSLKVPETIKAIKDLIKFNSIGGISLGGQAHHHHVAQAQFLPPIKFMSFEGMGKLGWRNEDACLLDEIYKPGVIQILL